MVVAGSGVVVVALVASGYCNMGQASLTGVSIQLIGNT